MYKESEQRLEKGQTDHRAFDVGLFKEIVTTA